MSVKHLFAAVLFSLGTLYAFVPVPVSAVIVPCGRTQDDPATPLPTDESKPYTICHIVVGANSLIQWGMNIMTIFAITVIFAMGVLYVVSAGNSGMMQTGVFSFAYDVNSNAKTK